MLSGIDLATSCIMSGEGVRMDVASKIRVLKTVYATLPCHTCGEKDVAAIRCRKRTDLATGTGTGGTREEHDLTVFRSNSCALYGEVGSSVRQRSIWAVADFSFMVQRSLRQFSQDKWCRMSFGGERGRGKERGEQAGAPKCVNGGEAKLVSSSHFEYHLRYYSDRPSFSTLF